MFKDLIEKISKIMFRKKKKECNHESATYERSNVLQLDDMGYPLRLCIRRCDNCGKSKQVWLDVPKQALKELETGESVLCSWKRNKPRPNEKKMTCREKMELEKPHLVDKDKYIGGCDGCPHDYGHAEEPYYCKDGYYEQDNACWDCWGREVEEREEKEDDL